VGVFFQFGSISEEKLMGLLDLALSSNTISTVLKAREFINSGVEPLDLVVQLMSLVQRILDGSGTSKQPPVVVRACYGAQFFSYNKPCKFFPSLSEITGACFSSLLTHFVIINADCLIFCIAGFELLYLIPLLIWN
jgi:hypothetical protein